MLILVQIFGIFLPDRRIIAENQGGEGWVGEKTRYPSK